MLLRCNGRSRRGLKKFTPAAPEPCSAASYLPLSTMRGSLRGLCALTLSIYAFFCSFADIIPQLRRFVNPFSWKTLKVVLFACYKIP